MTLVAAPPAVTICDFQFLTQRTQRGEAATKSLPAENRKLREIREPRKLSGEPKLKTKHFRVFGVFRGKESGHFENRELREPRRLSGELNAILTSRRKSHAKGTKDAKVF